MNVEKSRPETRGFLTYVRDHWRGRLSLGRSFWVNGIALNICLRGVMFVEAALLHEVSFGAGLPLASVIVLEGVMLVSISVWQLIGIWRSAVKHYENTDKRTWAGLAQLTVLVGFVSIATSLTDYNAGVTAALEASSSGDESYGIAADGADASRISPARDRLEPNSTNESCAALGQDPVTWESDQLGVSLSHPGSWEEMSVPSAGTLFMVKNCFLCGEQETFSIVAADPLPGDPLPDVDEFLSTIREIFPDAEVVDSGMTSVGATQAPFIRSRYTLTKEGVSVKRSLSSFFVRHRSDSYVLTWGAGEKTYNESFPILRCILGSWEWQ